MIRMQSNDSQLYFTNGIFFFHIIACHRILPTFIIMDVENLGWSWKSSTKKARFSSIGATSFGSRRPGTKRRCTMRRDLGQWAAMCVTRWSGMNYWFTYNKDRGERGRQCLLCPDLINFDSHDRGWVRTHYQQYIVHYMGSPVNRLMRSVVM